VIFGKKNLPTARFDGLAQPRGGFTSGASASICFDFRHVSHTSNVCSFVRCHGLYSMVWKMAFVGKFYYVPGRGTSNDGI